MVRQYPYQLFAIKATTGGRDSQGYPIKSPEGGTFEFLCDCRDQAGKGQYIKTDAGETSLYTCIIHCPLSCPDLKVGTQIQVKGDNGQVRVTGRILSFRREQLHIRIWV